jgi:hypothetical protein
MESKAVNHLFREKWQRQAAPGSGRQRVAAASVGERFGAEKKGYGCRDASELALDVQTNVEGAVRTAEVKSNVMKDAVPISPSAGPSHFCFPWPVKCAPEAFTTSPGCFLLFRTGGLVVRGLWSRSPVFRFLLFPSTSFPGARENVVPNRAKSCQKVPKSAMQLHPLPVAPPISAFCFTHIKIKIGKEKVKKR